jgi:hypothetical protein
MELVDMTLQQYVAARGGLTTEQQKAVLKLLEGIARLGVDHGDVHSGNIAVNRGFKLLMIDFSESKKARPNVHAQVAKLVGDLGVVFPVLKFPVLEAYAKQGLPAKKASSCEDEDSFLRFVRERTGLNTADEDVQDALLDLWMDSDTADCEALLRKVRRRFKLP